MQDNLFQNFQPHTKTQWKQQVIKDLKDTDFDKTLLWEIDENVKMEAYYTSQDTINQPLNLIQSPQNQRVNASWLYREAFTFINEKECNSLIINGLLSGTNSILIDFCGVCERQVEVKELLRNIKLSDTPFFFKVENNALNLVKTLQQIAPYHWKGGINNDGLALWMLKGILPENHWIESSQILGIVQKMTAFKVVIINSHHFHNAGANVGQELAYTLASAIETIERLSEQNLSLQEIVQKIEFSISIGTNYFAEIAKVRALRFLWYQILSDGFGMKHSDIPATSIHCETSTFYQASITPHTNILRATTEAMSAVIGGCDALTIKAFDETFQESNDFSRRIARNISIILHEESYLDKVIDPSAGSYFIENLTFKIVDESLQLLKEVEMLGGISKAFKQNYIQNEIKRNFEYKQTDLISRKTTMVGVNKFRYDEVPFMKNENETKQSNECGFELLKDLRLSSVFEK